MSQFINQRVVSQNSYLIYFALFIFMLIISRILLYQYSLANKSQTSSKSPSEKIYFDIVCYQCPFTQKYQAFSLVERYFEGNISSLNELIDKWLFTIKGLINQSKEVVKSAAVLLKYRFFGLKKLLEEIQAKNTTMLKLYHPQDNLRFINGLVLGEKSPEAGYLPAFTNAGMLHVLVASGFNVALVAGAAWQLVRFSSRKLQLMIILAAIWGYVIFLDFQPPLLRAAWMFTLVFWLKFLGKRTSRIRILAWSLVIILLIQPALVSSLSLWLSALATLGILIFSRRLSLFWAENTLSANTPFFSRFVSLFLEEGVVSLSAQALIFPLLIWYFHSLNLVSFLANPALLPWLGTITQVAGIEFLLTFLEKFWLARVILGAISWVMNGVLERYFAAVTWWQHLSFLNQTTSHYLENQYLAAWAGIIVILLIVTRKKREVKTHFFHEKTV